MAIPWFCVATVCACVQFGHAAILSITKLPHNQVSVSLRDPGEPQWLEVSRDLRSFEPAGILTNTLVRTALNRDEIYRARNVPPSAAAYFLRAGLTNQADSSIPPIQSEIIGWFDALQNSGLASAARYVVSFRPEYRGGGYDTVPALLGPSARPNRALVFGNGGVLFDGSTRLTLPNPLPDTPKEFTIFAVFASAPGAYGLILGGDEGEGKAAPGLWAGGDPYVAQFPENLSFTVTTDGAVSGSPGFHQARTFNWGNRFTPQTVVVTAAVDGKLSIQTDIDREYQGAARTCL